MTATDRERGAHESGIGAAVPRVEDHRLLTGRGRYVDDMPLPNVAFAYVVRSPHAHARIARIDKRPALGAPGVLVVLTGEDAVAERLSGLPCASFPSHVATGSPKYRPVQPI